MPKTYETIATTTISSATTSVTLSSIPATYTDLVLKFYIPSTSGSGDNWSIRLNGDSTAKYNIVRDLSNYPYATGDRNAGITALYGILGSSSYATVGTWDIFNYASDKFKFLLHKGSTYNQRTDMIAATYASTAAINSITLFQYSTSNTMAVGSKISLHGIKRT